jgi:hypothetical protein
MKLHRRIAALKVGQTAKAPAPMINRRRGFAEI